ncbi:MAG: hypothetical protein A2075_11535 [Geobacteraceae bacterium GWC2_58_44]|nr:MAG: hypothetical protein A2075_11535 [Geobacteraceae bacterium GWC2_58_44]HBG04818.1 hypothetical protein [Geobacter sp.]
MTQPDMMQEADTLAELSSHRVAHLDREESFERFKQETKDRWKDYLATGKAVADAVVCNTFSNPNPSWPCREFVTRP